MTACLASAATGPCCPQVLQPALGPPQTPPALPRQPLVCAGSRSARCHDLKSCQHCFLRLTAYLCVLLPISFFISWPPLSAHRDGSQSTCDGSSPFVLLICTAALPWCQQQLKEEQTNYLQLWHCCRAQSPARAESGSPLCPGQKASAALGHHPVPFAPALLYFSPLPDESQDRTPNLLPPRGFIACWREAQHR